eukprot:724386-Alexandrium_andersonii.AAC.1
MTLLRNQTRNNPFATDCRTGTLAARPQHADPPVTALGRRTNAPPQPPTHGNSTKSHHRSSVKHRPFLTNVTMPSRSRENTLLTHPEHRPATANEVAA